MSGQLGLHRRLFSTFFECGRRRPGRFLDTDSLRQGGKPAASINRRVRISQFANSANSSFGIGKTLHYRASVWYGCEMAASGPFTALPRAVLILCGRDHVSQNPHRRAWACVSVANAAGDNGGNALPQGEPGGTVPVQWPVEAARADHLPTGSKKHQRPNVHPLP